jgi:serine/threonine protein kinase
MSFLDGSSFSASFTFLALDFGALDNDPYRSRNTIANAQNAYNRGLFSKSNLVKDLGAGAVFQVTLRKSKTTPELYAVKTAHTADARGSSRTSSTATGVFPVLREIQVVSHAVAKIHPNILDVIGWDWGTQRIPVVFVEYAELGTLKDFLPIHGSGLSAHQKRKLCLDVACGLNALHSIDIAHGDVKLTNTLVFGNPKAGYVAKVSDFSHSILGLSTRRKCTYPGSALYNAPEIRNRNDIVLSDRIPRCETFSFGLLVWEVVKNGSHFFDTDWISQTSSSLSSVRSHDHESLESLGSSGFLDLAKGSIESMGPDGLLNKAQCFLSKSRMSPYDWPIFHQVFGMTLKDRPDRRKDMQSVAMALDTYDE